MTAGVQGRCEGAVAAGEMDQGSRYGPSLLEGERDEGRGWVYWYARGREGGTAAAGDSDRGHGQTPLTGRPLTLHDPPPVSQPLTLCAVFSNSDLLQDTPTSFSAFRGHGFCEIQPS